MICVGGSIDKILESTPRIIIDIDVDKAVADRIRFIDKNIHEKTFTFIKEAIKIGELSLENNVELYDLEPTNNNVERDPNQLVIEYFKYRYDLKSSYDASTEKAIQDDMSHQNFLQNVRHRNYQGEEAIKARDAIRRSRFSIYLGRVSSHAKLVQTDDIAIDKQPKLLATSLSHVV